MGKVITLTPPPYSAALQLASSIQSDIRTLRDAGYPQVEIAARVGADPVTVYRWECGTHAPRTPEQWCTVHLWAERVRLQQSHS